jgi:hypothetical protein
MSFVTPAVAYRVSDTLSVGACRGASGVSCSTCRRAWRTPNDMSALTGALGEATEGLEIPVISELTLPPPWFQRRMTPYATQGHLELFVEDYFTTSYNLGVLWQPYDWFALGACYQSESEANMYGRLRVQVTATSSAARTTGWAGRPLTIITAAIFDLPTRSVPSQKGSATFQPHLAPEAPVRHEAQARQAAHPDVRRPTGPTGRPEEWVMQFDQKIQLFRFARMLGYTVFAGQPGLRSRFQEHLAYDLRRGDQAHREDRPTPRLRTPGPPPASRRGFGPLPFPA